MTIIKTDICVIGAGAGGLSVAAGAVQMGAKVVLVEGGAMGGDCLNFGCVPSKALLAAGKAAAAHRAHAEMGIAPDKPAIDYQAAMEHVARTIAAIAPHDSQERFETLGVQVIRDWGRFVDARTIEAGGHRIRARRFVVATGSRPTAPPIPGLNTVPFLTNETLFDLRQAPGHLVIIGAGPIGLEMAQAHRRLGCAVTVIEGARAMGRDDPDAAALIVARLRDEGVQILENVAIEHVSGRAGAIEVQVAGGSVVIGTHLLVATGRKPNIERLDLDKAGVKTGRGGISVDRGLRSSNRRVYAIGDVAGLGQFTHLAGYHGGLILRPVLFGLPARVQGDHVPRVTYTAPELAQIGPTEAEARAAHGDRLQVIRLDLTENDRALAEGAGKGFIKLMVVGGRPLGVTIVAPVAGEMIALWSLAIANRLKLGAIARTILPYPTMGELSKRATGTYFSPKLFDNPTVKRLVGLVQRVVP